MFEKIKSWFTKKKPKHTYRITILGRFVNESMNYKVEPSKFRDYPMTHAASVAIGYATNDGLVGGIIGGDLVVGMIGDALNTSESTPNNTSSYESPSYESPSYDSGSSGCDMGGGYF